MGTNPCVGVTPLWVFMLPKVKTTSPGKIDMGLPPGFTQSPLTFLEVRDVFVVSLFRDLTSMGLFYTFMEWLNMP